MKKKIILASRSKARHALLRQIGLRPKVIASSAREDRNLKSRCGDLVVSNALSKARDVAKRMDSGIVIAADTVVLSGKKIIGKPKSGDDAFKTLKLLTRRPQWVYSGLAVLDVKAGKAYTAHEKTKVYMRRLTDRQIRGYLKRAYVLDKAGSFDIQGLGSVFVDRIEGCYSNVVGLPLARLAVLLKKAGVDIC
jgi:septum formation protein